MKLGRVHAFALVFLLASCGGPAENSRASDDALQRYAYRPTTPPEIRLLTVVSKRSGSGAHSALLISTQSERILFDPAGSFALPMVPERDDVLYGITPNTLARYIDHHARETYDLIEQRLAVSDKQARRIAAIAKSSGPVPRAQCALSIGRILTQVDGFQSIKASYFPNAIRRQFAALSGVETQVFQDDDADRSEDGLTGKLALKRR